MLLVPPEGDMAPAVRREARRVQAHPRVTTWRPKGRQSPTCFCTEAYREELMSKGPLWDRLGATFRDPEERPAAPERVGVFPIAAGPSLASSSCYEANLTRCDMADGQPGRERVARRLARQAWGPGMGDQPLHLSSAGYAGATPYTDFVLADTHQHPRELWWPDAQDMADLSDTSYRGRIWAAAENSSPRRSSGGTGGSIEATPLTTTSGRP